MFDSLILGDRTKESEGSKRGKKRGLTLISDLNWGGPRIKMTRGGAVDTPGSETQGGGDDRYTTMSVVRNIVRTGKD